MNRLTLVACGVAFTAGLGVLVAPRANEVSAPVSAKRVVASPEAPAVGCSFEVGTRRSWWLHTSTQLTLDPSALGASGADLPTHVDARARLQVEVLSRDDSGGVLLASLANVDATTAQRVGADLQQAFLLRVGADCAIAGFGRHRSTSQVAARTQQALTAELWFQNPTSATASIEAEDGTGHYRATVARDDGALRRRIIDYSTVWPTTLGAKSAVAVEDALLTVRRDEGLWFASMKGHSVLYGQVLRRAKSEFSVEPAVVDESTLANADRNVASYVWENLLPRPVALPPSTSFTAAEQRQHAELKHQTLEQTVTQFATRIEQGTAFHNQWKELSAYLEARPDVIPEFSGALQDGVFPNDMTPAAYLALGKARVPEARDALLEISRSGPRGSLHRIQAALLLADRVDTPTSYATELRQASRSSDDPMFARHALLALGMFASRQGLRDEQIVVEARGAIADALSAGQTAAQLSPAFGAMGNVGDPASLPSIAQWSRHADRAVRAAVPLALRRLPIDVETPLLIEWLERENAPEVRRELYSTLRDQLLDEQRELPAVFVTRAIADLRAQPGLLTRQSLVRMLAPLAAHDAAAKRALLEQVRVEVLEDSGLYDVLSAALPGNEVSAVLRTLPEMASQPPTQVPAVPLPGPTPAFEVAR